MLGVNTIPGIEEVNIFKDETVIHFVNPKGIALQTPVFAAFIHHLQMLICTL
jgi:hypothetical protein